MSPLFPLDIEYLVFTANHSRYGVSYLNVVAVMDVPAHTAVPSMPSEVRGVIPFQGHSIPLFDLRACFGERSRLQETEELVQTMAQRKQDHINWLNKLKEEVFGNKPITVQTDPHKCAFGKWYDTFHSDNTNLNSYMQRFNDPHQQIHHVAIDAADMIQQGHLEEAKNLLYRTEDELLKRLLALFDGIAEQVRQYLLEYAVVFNINDQLFALAVDDINVFSRLSHIEHPVPAGITSGDRGFVQAIGRYQADGHQQEQNVLLLDVQRIVAQ